MPLTSDFQHCVVKEGLGGHICGVLTDADMMNQLTQPSKVFGDIHNATTAANIALADMAGDSRTINYISLLSFGFGRRITPGFRINNELL